MPAAGTLLVVLGLLREGHGIHALERSRRHQEGSLEPIPERAIHAVADRRMLIGGAVVIFLGSEGDIGFALRLRPNPRASDTILTPPGAQYGATLGKPEQRKQPRDTRTYCNCMKLVGRGLTSAQVAEELFLSRRTVDTHLTSIYRKLGVSSRAAAIRFALEHELA